MNYNLIYGDGEIYEILKEVSVYLFQNRDRSLNQKVLGMYVHELGGNRVMKRGGKLLILKQIEDAIIVE
jgi:hypothetical protein|tara:strand:- start:425 stop:631 length:207 start_codon:yes stop_codon:yes gene_type:complete